MSLSVVMPNFNHGKWLPRSLHALLSQSEPPDEIIVIDDASTDDSVAIVKRFASKHPSIRLIRHETDLGAVAGMTNGLAAAQSEFALFAAADDFVLPGLLERACAALRRYPQAALFCAGAAVIDPDGRITDFRPFTEPARVSRYISPQDVRRLIRSSDNWIIGPTVVYRRDMLLAIGGYDPALGSFCDGIVVRNLALRHGFYFDPDILAAFTVYPQSYSSASALSASKSRALIDVVLDRGVKMLPPDIRDYYGDLLARRLRFNMSRLSLVFETPDADGAANVFGGSNFDRRMMQFLAHIPVLNRIAVLGWMFVRSRPFGVRSVIKSWWDHARSDPSRRAHVAPLIAEIGSMTMKGAGEP